MFIIPTQNRCVIILHPADVLVPEARLLATANYKVTSLYKPPTAKILQLNIDKTTKRDPNRFLTPRDSTLNFG